MYFDGIPVEFYKQNWSDIGYLLIRSIRAAFITGELSITQKRGVITCIPKGDKPREFLKNWRPISLLTTDYKIITSVMANRMKTVLDEIIGPDQKGFLKDRYIEENTRLVYDLIQYCKEKKKEGILVLIDFEKAFDSIEWSYITKVLTKYNFGVDFIHFFDMVYKDAQSCVINNGNYSEFFQLGRGCRQGDPWSPYLFILCIEPLAQRIKQEQNITGLKIGNYEIKLGQYADDTFLILDGSEISISSCMQILQRFGNISGLTVNVDKTQVIKLGSDYAETVCPVLNIPFRKRFKLLGIEFSVNLDEIEELNFRGKITKIQNIIRLYQWRNLTIAGKITIMKMQILPNLVHLLAVLPSPKPQLFTEINSIITNFIWNNKRPKIQMNTLVQDYWKIIAKEIFKEKEIPFIFEGDSKLIKRLANKTQNQFWKEVLNTWEDYRENIDNIPENIKIPNIVIWSSGLIKNDNLLNRRNRFMSNGLMYLKDLYDYDKKHSKRNNKFQTNMTLILRILIIYALYNRYLCYTKNKYNNIIKMLIKIMAF